MNSQHAVDDFLNPSWFGSPAVYPVPYTLLATAADDVSRNYFTFDSESAPAPYQEHSSGRTAQRRERSTPNALKLFRPGLELPNSENGDASPKHTPSLLLAAGGFKQANSLVSEAPSPRLSPATTRSSGGISGTYSRRISASSSSSAIKQDHRQIQKAGEKTSQQPPCRSSASANLKAKAPHSVVERRYRNKLNDKIMQLHLVLMASKLTTGTPAELTGLGGHNESACKVGKAEIMINAINYVEQAELQMRHMARDVERLQGRVLQLESLLPYEPGLLRSQLTSTT